MSTTAIEEALRGRLDERTLNRLISGFLSAPHISVWIKGLDRRYSFVSPGWEEHAGVPREQAIGRRDEDFRPAEMAARFREVDDRIVGEGIVETREDHVATADGQRSFMTTKFPLRDTDDRIIGIAGIAAETTDVRRLRAETRANRDLLASVVETTSDGIVRFRPDLVVTFSNPAFFGFTGASDRVTVDRPLSDLLFPNDVARIVEVVSGLTARAPSASFDQPTRDRSGRPRWRLWRLKGVFDDNEALAEIQASVRDVSDERFYQQALERIIATSNDLDLALSSVLTEVLAVGLDYLELDIGMVARIDDGDYSFRHVQGTDRAVIESGPITGKPDLLASALIDSHEAIVVEDVARSRFASHRTHLNFDVSFFVGQRIEVAGVLLGTVTFYGFKPRTHGFRPAERTLLRIMAQWLAFAFDRDQRTRALSDSRAELAMILEHLPAHVIYMDGDGRVIEANAAARTAIAPQESRSVDLQSIAEKRSILGKVERWESQQGENLWMRTDRIPFRILASGDERLLVVATDVSRLVEKEQALAKANERLNQFAYIASHDLQEPLRKIGAFTDLLIDGMKRNDADDIDYATKVIKESARRASVLINDLLAWSRITNRPIERTPIAFAAFVRHILADLLSTRAEIVPEIVDRMEKQVLSADATQLRQLVENLLTNALKYRHQDRPLCLTFDFGPTEDGSLRFSLADNGIGFDPAYRKVIFEPFRRLHSERRYSGTGVGLAICRRVCDSHGWFITAEGRPGEGATFVITMPRRGQAD